jgi:prepilin-type N-terminal cleavage/methylation domain-containing protein
MFNKNSYWYKRTMIGFTLMEMIAVTVAIAILGAIAVVSYRSVYTKGLERAALASLVMLANQVILFIQLEN